MKSELPVLKSAGWPLYSVLPREGVLLAVGALSGQDVTSHWTLSAQEQLGFFEMRCVARTLGCLEEACCFRGVGFLARQGTVG